MEHRPAISVVMSVYERAEWLPASIQSVLQQSFGDFEFLIINDGSQDPAVQATLEEYAATDGRIRLIHKKQNEGLTAALIDGCQQARGRYIARIDAGDRMRPERLARQKQVLDQHPDCHLVSAQVAFLGPDWEPLWIARGEPDSPVPVWVLPSDPREKIQADIPHHGSTLFRKSAYDRVGGYRRAFYYGQDWDLWYRLAEIGTYFVVPQVLYEARLFPDAISLSHSRRQAQISRYSLAAHLARRQGQPEAPILAKAREIRPGTGPQVKRTNGYYFIGEALRRNRNPACRRYLWRAIQFDPCYFRAYYRWVQSLLL